MTDPSLASAGEGLIRIVAWEWGRRPISEVRSWPWGDFHAALITITDSRFKVVRRERRAEEVGMSSLKKQLG